MIFGEHAKCQAEAEYPDLWRGLVGAWSPCLSPRGGKVLRDLSGRGNHGTLENLTPATSWTLDFGFGSVVFGGGVTTGIIRVADSAADPVALSLANAVRPRWSISAWVRPYNYTNSFPIIYTYGRWRASLGTKQTSGLLTHWRNNATEYVANSSVPTNVMSHVVLTNEPGDTIRFYLNGVTDGTFSSVATVNANTGSAIGGAANGSVVDNSWTGAVADVLVHEKTLTHREIITLYRLGPGGWATPRRRRWNYATAQTAIPYWVFARKNARLIGGGVT